MNHGEIVPVIPGSIGNTPQLTVDARALHAVLHVKRDFSNWIKGRISKYGFIEGEDFEKSSIVSSSPNLANGDFKGLRQSVEYNLSLSMGKELAMVENNEHGRLVRRYFIECERKAQEKVALPVVAARLSLSTIEERRPLGELVKEWAKVTGMLTGKAWGKINTHFGLRQVGDLPREMLPEAEAFVQGQIDAFRRAMEMTMPESTDSSPEAVLIPKARTECVREARPVSGSGPMAARLALPSGRDQVDLGAVDAVLRRAEDLCVSYNLTIRELVEELRAPFGAARQDNHLQEPVRSFATSVLYGISDLQTACSVVHNATLNAVRMAVDGCRLLEAAR